MPFQIFDRESLNVQPLNLRRHDLALSDILSLKGSSNRGMIEKMSPVAARMINAKGKGSSIIWMMGAHVIRAGVQKFLIDLLERGYVSCIAMNGAGVIHDFEFALIGATTESVARYIVEGQFGLWKETGHINDIINNGYVSGLGLGESVGKAISEGDFKYKEISVLANAYRLNIPVTVHVGIGCDIIHEHPNCDGAATGATSYHDFLYLAKIIENLENGVVMNFGSAVMAPEVYLKALSMARNVVHQRGESITQFLTLVCDLYDLPEDFSKEPPKDSPAYYFRPWKTMLVRTVADGGESFYIKGRHSETIPALWAAINAEEKI